MSRSALLWLAVCLPALLGAPALLRLALRSPRPPTTLSSFPGSAHRHAGPKAPGRLRGGPPRLAPGARWSATTTDGRGFFLQRGGNTFLTLRSFNSFSEYDALRAFRASVAERIGPDGERAGQLYDRGDVALPVPAQQRGVDAFGGVGLPPPGSRAQRVHGGLHANGGGAGELRAVRGGVEAASCRAHRRPLPRWPQGLLQ